MSEYHRRKRVAELCINAGATKRRKVAEQLEVVRESIRKLSDIIEEPLPPRFDDEDGTLGLNGLPQTFGQRDAPVDAWNAQAAADQRERVRSSSAGSSEKQDELSSNQSTSDKLSTNGSDGYVRDREAEFQHLSTADRELDDDDASASIDIDDNTIVSTRRKSLLIKRAEAIMVADSEEESRQAEKSQPDVDAQPGEEAPAASSVAAEDRD